MKKKITFLAMAILAVVVTSCSHTTSVAYQNAPECMGIDQNGKQRLLVYGIGRDHSDARFQAKKNAVAAVIFDGIKNGADGCNTKPLVFEVNAREKYEDFFNQFFNVNGDYDQFVDYQKTKWSSADRVNAQHTFKIGIVLYVDRPALKKYLIEKGIIKQ